MARVEVKLGRWPKGREDIVLVRETDASLCN